MGLLLLRCATMAKQRGIFRFKNKKPHVSDLQFSSEFTLQSIHTKQTDFFSAEDSLKKAIAINSTNDETYAELGLLYRTYSYFSQAEEPLKKAIALNPLNDKAYVELGIVYLNLGKNSDAGTLFQKATMLNPKNEQAYYELGGFYLGQGNLSLAEDSLKKAIALNPVNANAYVDLIETYLRQNRLSEAEETYSKAIKFADDNDRLQGVVKVISNAFGNHKLAQKYFEKADELRTKYYLPSVVNNYRKIGEILIQRKIKLVCVQYPMRNIEPLKRIFEDKEGIIFVDNEKLFKDAVRREGYWGYFTDMYGGDFGHCTEKGNRLLAENIANVIIKEVFYK